MAAAMDSYVLFFSSGRKDIVCGQIGHKAPSITKAPTLVGFHNQATLDERGRAASLGDADRRTCPPNTAA